MQTRRRDSKALQITYQVELFISRTKRKSVPLYSAGYRIRLGDFAVKWELHRIYNWLILVWLEMMGYSRPVRIAPTLQIETSWRFVRITMEVPSIYESNTLMLSVFDWPILEISACLKFWEWAIEVDNDEESGSVKQYRALALLSDRARAN